MNEEIQKKLLEYVNNAEVFLSAETPLYFQEFITYHRYSALTYTVLNLVLSVALLALLYKLYKSFLYLLDMDVKGGRYSSKFSNNDILFSYILFGSILSVFLFISTVSASYYVDKYVKITMAPRVFVIDSLRGK